MLVGMTSVTIYLVLMLIMLFREVFVISDFLWRMTSEVIIWRDQVVFLKDQGMMWSSGGAWRSRCQLLWWSRYAKDIKDLLWLSSCDEDTKAHYYSDKVFGYKDIKVYLWRTTPYDKQRSMKSMKTFYQLMGQLWCLSWTIISSLIRRIFKVTMKW